MGGELSTRSNNIFSKAARLWGPVAVFRVYSCVNSPAEEYECLSICPRLGAKALQSDLSEDLKGAVFQFWAFSHLWVTKTPKKVVMLFSAMEIDFISFKSIFSFIAIAEKVWGFFGSNFLNKTISLGLKPSMKGLIQRAILNKL